MVNTGGFGTFPPAFAGGNIQPPASVHPPPFVGGHSAAVRMKIVQ